MRKVELLAPAGSFEALVAAVQNGADAIYMAGSRFGARAFAQNFDEAALQEAISYAHLYGVKIYITVNTLMYDEDMEQVLSYIDQLVAVGADAIIVQDLGLMDLVQKRYPALELHASTQMHIHNLEGFAYLLQRGVQRAVVARECSVEEIESFSKVGIDLEVFVQGALCVSYSGQCLMSSYLKGRSGNRGECAQHCRMQYRLLEDEKVIADTQYLLSPKDLNALEEVPALIEAGIHSFKIEGRMKRPEYVAQVVKMYRKAIDAYYAQTQYADLAQDQDDLRKIFNRDFTKGHLFHQTGSRLMNFYRPNHIGVEIGKIIAVNKDKMKIKLSRALQQGDGVRILQTNDDGFTVNRLYKDGLLVSSAQAGDIVELDNKGFVEKGAQLVKTSDVLQLKAIQQHYESAPRKIEINLEAHLFKGAAIVLILEDDAGNRVEYEGDVLLEQSLKQPLDEARIKSQLEKLGATAFVARQTTLYAQPDVFVPIKALNEARRIACERLVQARIARTPLEKKEISYAASEVQPTRVLSVDIQNKAQYDALKALPIASFYVEHKALQRELSDDPRVKWSEPRIHRYPYTLETADQIGEVGGLLHGGTSGNASLNVTNANTLAMLHQERVERVMLSKELSLSQIQTLLERFENLYHQRPNVEVMVYDYPELMVMEYCPIHTVKKDQDKKNCQLCKGKVSYHLEDIHATRYRLQGNERCVMSLYATKVHSRLHELEALVQAGVGNVRMRFDQESPAEMQALCAQVLQQIQS